MQSTDKRERRFVVNPFSRRNGTEFVGKLTRNRKVGEWKTRSNTVTRIGLDWNREKEKVNFPLSLLTALSSYLSASFRGFCPSRRGQHAPRDEKLRDLINGACLFHKNNCSRRFLLLDNYLFFFQPVASFLISTASSSIAREMAWSAFIRDFAFVRITKLWSTIFSIGNDPREKRTYTPLTRDWPLFNAIPRTIYNLRSDVSHSVVLGRGMSSI